MTRRHFLALPAAGAWVGRLEAPVTVPVHVIQDVKALRPDSLHDFLWRLWPDTVSEFAHCGVQFRTTFSSGAVERPPYREPVITPLEEHAVNLAVTDRIPSYWDNGRNLSGITKLHRGYHLCVIAMATAHGNAIPLFALNTCVHELLHAIMGDIFETQAGGVARQARESRIDWLATQMWLLHSGGPVRQAAAKYVARLQA